MGCTKHPQRRKADCPECHVRVVIPKVEDVQPVKKKKFSKEIVQSAVDKVRSDKELENIDKLEKKFENKLENTVYKPKIPLTCMEDVDREVRIEVSKIREYIDGIFAQALEKVKQDINQIKHIRWEHASIPLTIFNIDLMLAIQQDGWKLIEFMKNAKQYGYPDQPDYAVVQRITKPENTPLPDLSKPGNVRKYLEKKNGLK